MMTPDDLDVSRRSARLLLRAARSPQIHIALPALRRIVNAGASPFDRLVAAFAHRTQIRLKHALRTIAIECGAASWEALCAQSAPLTATQRLQLRFDQRPRAAHVNAWFSNTPQALAAQQAHGGRVIGYGRSQAIVIDETLFAALLDQG